MGNVSCIEEIKNIKVYEADEYTPEIKFYSNYLEFTFNISFIDVVNILEAIQEDEEYYRLSSGDYVFLKNKGLMKISSIIGERKIENKSALKGWFTGSRKISLTTGRVYRKKTNLEEEIVRK